MEPLHHIFILSAVGLIAGYVYGVAGGGRWFLSRFWAVW
jgi:hypothetical protein